MEALTELGELDEAEAALAAGLPTGDPPEACLSGAHLLERRAQLRLAQGRYDEAHADLMQAADWWKRLRIHHPATAAWRVIDAEALVALGDRRAARELAVAHLELAERTGLPEPRGAGLRALALTAEPERGGRAAGAGGGSARGQSPPGWSTPGRWSRSGGAPAGQPPRGRARAAAPGPRPGPARRDAAARRPRPARAAGDRGTAAPDRPHRRRRADPVGAAGGRLAARGQGNREIAQQLYVTRRTVETHLTHVFGKLGVSSRSELVELLTVHAAADR